LAFKWKEGSARPQLAKGFSALILKKEGKQILDPKARTEGQNIKQKQRISEKERGKLA